MHNEHTANVVFGAVKVEGENKECVMMFPGRETLAMVIKSLPYEHKGELIVSCRPIDGEEAAEIGAL